MPITSASSAHDTLAGYSIGGTPPTNVLISSTFQPISNGTPFIFTFTPTVTGAHDFVIKAGSVATGGGGGLRLVFRVSVNPQTMSSYFGDVFNSDAVTANWAGAPNAQTSIAQDAVMGSASLTAGVTYYAVLGGGGGTTGGTACVDVIAP